MSNLAILGASGHGKVLADIAELTGWNNIVFYDDAYPGLSSVEHWQVIGNGQDLLNNYLLNNSDKLDGVIVGIGSNSTRLRLYQNLVNHNVPLITLLHPTAVISKYSNICAGSVVMAGAVVNSFAQIGQACIINTSATVDHDCQLADGVHISPGVNLAGACTLGLCSWLGIGSTVKQLINIGSNVTVGAGSVVVKDIPDNQSVIGIPAKPYP